MNSTIRRRRSIHREDKKTIRRSASLPRKNTNSSRKIVDISIFLDKTIKYKKSSSRERKKSRGKKDIQKTETRKKIIEGDGFRLVVSRRRK